VDFTIFSSVKKDLADKIELSSFYALIKVKNSIIKIVILINQKEVKRTRHEIYPNILRSSYDNGQTICY
jgi:hypothetical protein